MTLRLHGALKAPADLIGGVIMYFLKENMYARNVGLRRCFMFTEELMQVKSLQFFFGV